MELRPNNNLINVNFDGYKLSLEPIPILEVALSTEPYQAKPDTNQYSLQHVQLFSLHNHLIRNPWEPCSGYFIDCTFNVQKVKYNFNTGILEHSANNIYSIPTPTSDDKRQSGDYNVSMIFPTEKYAVIFDGCGTISLLDIGNIQVNNTPWKCIYSTCLEAANRQCLLRDARLEFSSDGRKYIHCILMNIRKIEDENKLGSPHEIRLIWLQLIQDADNSQEWTMAYLNEIKCKSFPIYCSIESKHKTLLLCADCEFSLDEHNQPDNNSIDSYVWCQTDEDIMISISIERNALKNNFKIICNNENTVKIFHKNFSIFNVELYDRVQCGLTTWSLENETIKLNLIKSTKNIWPKLTVNGSNINEQPVNVIPEEMPGFSYQNDREDCDELHNEYNLVRIDGLTGTVTHRINLGLQKPLFTLSLRAGQLDALAIQNNIDACLWLPQISAANPTQLHFSHEGTINAFSYIEASKKKKKFIQCAPDMSYAVICEPRRHIFFYFARYNSAASLKNRNGQKWSVGQQKLFTIPEALDETDPIVLGMLVENDMTILLMKNHILCLKING